MNLRTVILKSMKPKIIIICGPTALGKTSTAIMVAEKFNGEIVGADSMQVYRFMDIGTAKPTSAEKARIRHHMIDIVDPDEPFDARQFTLKAHEKITKLCARGILPFIVGGTGLYIKALVHGLCEAIPSDIHIRNQLKSKIEKHGLKVLYQRLNKYDPETAKKLHPNDTTRIIRALEVYELTGKTISQYHEEHKFTDEPFHVLKIGLHIDRDILYDRINRRVDAMMAKGFLDEVKGLLDKGYTTDLKSMQSIGYRHLVAFIHGDISWNEAIRTLKRDTRRYAKRQLTWFKADPEIQWYEPGRLDEIKTGITRFLQQPVACKRYLDINTISI